MNTSRHGCALAGAFAMTATLTLVPIQAVASGGCPLAGKAPAHTVTLGPGVEGRAPSGVRVRFMGVSTLSVSDGRTTLLVDGFFSRPGLISWVTGIRSNPRRIEEALDRAGLSKVDAIMVAHAHHDHAMDSALIARRFGSRLFGSPSVAIVAAGQGFHRVEPPPQGSAPVVIGSFSLKAIASPHSIPNLGGKGPNTRPLLPQARVWDYKSGENFSYLVQHHGRGVLIHPSANFERGAIKTALRCAPVDVVFLGVGGLGLKSESFIRDYWREVVQASGPRLVVPVHWDDFSRPLNRQPRPLPWPFDNFGRTMRILKGLAADDGVSLEMMPFFAPMELPLGGVPPTKQIGGPEGLSPPTP